MRHGLSSANIVSIRHPSLMRFFNTGGLFWYPVCFYTEVCCENPTPDDSKSG